MSIFQLNNKKLEPVKEKSFDLEKDIQRITEENLELVLGLKFVSGTLNQEFSVRAQEQDFYIDTLGFDEAQRAFVIIEYKKDKSFSVIDQGFAYLSAMLNHKADFILEINERLHKNFTKKDIDWEQSRVIFISLEFTNYQKNAINFKNLPIYLYEVRFYTNNIVEFNPIKPYSTTESITSLSKDKTIQNVSKEVKVYTLDDHYKKTSDQLREVFEKLREQILRLDPQIKEKPVSWYVGYQLHGYNIASVQAYKDKLMVKITLEKPNDPKHLLKKASDSWMGWSKIPFWRFKLTDTAEIPYLMSLIEQAYKFRAK